MAEFAYPPFYQLPPFFTVQPNVDSRAKQFEIWCQLITDYCIHKKFHELSVKDGLFENEAIKRKLAPQDITQIGDYVVKQSLGCWQDASKTTLIVYHKKDSEWANDIYRWANENGKLNSVETIFSIYQGEENSKEYVF